MRRHIAPKPLEYIAKLIDGDPRFFGVNADNLNYNANQLLVEAIAQGARGAYWAILSGLADKDLSRVQGNTCVPTPIPLTRFEPDTVGIELSRKPDDGAFVPPQPER